MKTHIHYVFFLGWHFLGERQFKGLHRAAIHTHGAAPAKSVQHPDSFPWKQRWIFPGHGPKWC